MRYFAKLICACLFVTSGAWGFDGHRVTDGPVTLEIGPVDGVAEYNKTYDVKVGVTNTGQEDLKVHLKVGGLIDEWRCVGDSVKKVTVAASQEAEVVLGILAEPGAYAALYPIHVYATCVVNGKERQLHAVRIFETTFPHLPDDGESRGVIELPQTGLVSLTRIRKHQVGWRFFGQPMVQMAQGWLGSADPSRANFVIGQIERGGVARQALIMHPPWYGGAGTVFADYRVQLPTSGPISLSFANAIRDSHTNEPQSDGVTFRVWVNGKTLYERHTASKTWVQKSVDLSTYTGQEVLLRLECHPGPNRDTTCDSAYWAEPVIRAGKVPTQRTATDKERMRVMARELAVSGKTAGPRAHVIPLDGGYRAGIVIGSQGITDTALAIAKGAACVAFDGLDISIMENRLGEATSSVFVEEVRVQKNRDSLRIHHTLVMGSESFDMTVHLFKDRLGLKISVDCDKRVTDVAAAAFDRKAERVYWGHGYCIVDPKPFRQGYGGHSLSTSHVGFDFEDGLSLVTACDHPPDFLQVTPATHTYALHTHMNATLTFVPSDAGALDAAIRYRHIDGRRASPGYRDKAGRFVFDVWGGAYGRNAELMQMMADYGLTDALLTLHVWQRWGYDYRLPDIYPPNPKLGTVEDMRALGRICDDNGIKWGLHDNYIDFYPDANEYSYDHICFSEAGEPIKAWNNTGCEAQSYRWRPDRIMPFVQRNWKQIAAELKPSHVFTDVFTSIEMFDFYDRHGTFHSSLETRKHWGESFRWIQDLLGPGSVTTSEAGDDQLVGYLDGADCQHLNISTTGGPFNITLDCADWSRVPWFDAVLHDRFSLHGVGYPGRYEGGRSRLYHGIESDDYLSNEILLGHALMVDYRAMPRGAMRKYWLAQDFIRSIATDTITSVQFASGDIHKQIVTWNSGAKVYVNRSSQDWPVAGKVLPEYGYYAVNTEIQSSIERINGTIVEQSSAPGRRYVNGRGFNPEQKLEISPVAQAVEYLGGRRFKMPIAWDARQPADKDCLVFVHFKHPHSPRYDKITFQGDERPNPRTSQWQGRVVTGKDRVLEIPESFGAGEYDVHIGLYDPDNSGRIALDWDETGHHTYVLGRLIASGSGAKITGIRLEPHVRKDRPAVRWNVARTPVRFPGTMTTGAFRCTAGKDELVVTPLPQMASFEIQLDPDALMPGSGTVTSLAAINNKGHNIKDVPYKRRGTSLIFDTAPEDFAYRVSFGN